MAWFKAILFFCNLEAAPKMEIKFHLGFATILDLIHIMERMEMETMVIILFLCMMTPFVFGSLWSIGISLMWELFWLGVRGGMFLSLACTLFLTFIKASSFKRFMSGHNQGAQDKEKTKCSLMDAILSVIFQTGLRIPTFMWDPLVRFLEGMSEVAVKGDRFNFQANQVVKTPARTAYPGRFVPESLLYWSRHATGVSVSTSSSVVISSNFFFFLLF